MKRGAVLYLMVVLLFLGCKKKEETPVPTLPPATTTGANTMGCYADGDLFTCAGTPNSLDGEGVTFGKGSYFIHLSGDESTGRRINIYVSDTIIETDTLYANLKTYPFGTSYVRSPPTTYYNVKENDPFNWVKFSRYDNSVVAGTFQFKGFSSAGDSVVVTQGRFDIAR